jgi:uncharacterized protein YutE (UPF0331/DUF86 family)
MVRRETLRQRLDVLLDALADLRRYRDTLGLDALRSDRDAQRMVLHALYVASQAAIDIAFHVAADAEQTLSPTYREIFGRLVDAGLMARPLADNLAGWAGLRNVLAHHYTSIDLTLIHRTLAEDLDDLEQLASLATEWLTE